MPVHPDTFPPGAMADPGSIRRSRRIARAVTGLAASTALFLVPGIGGIRALAANECGTATPGGTITCNGDGVPASDVNPYPNGIRYTIDGLDAEASAGARDQRSLPSSNTRLGIRVHRTGSGTSASRPRPTVSVTVSGNNTRRRRSLRQRHRQRDRQLGRQYHDPGDHGTYGVSAWQQQPSLGNSS